VALRGAQADADSCRDASDGPGRARAMKLAATLAALLQKSHRTAEDGDAVRVKAADMAAAAERATAGLRQIAERVTSERAAWPKCPACSQPVGAFADGDKSPLRALFERVARP
jgi:hypothetical protein